MLLVDAVHIIETVGGIWLGMSAVAFILLGVFEVGRKSRQEVPSARTPRLDLVAKGKKVAKAPATKAA
jgi:hypothetical protein